MGSFQTGNKGVDMKKAQLYSLIAILIVLPVSLFIGFFLNIQTNKSGFVMERIIADQEHQIAKNIEEDFGRALKIAGRRALLTAINRIIMKGEYLDNSSLRLSELMLNGSLNGTPEALMQNNTIKDWKEKLLQVDTGFVTDVNYSELKITNYDGFNIDFSAVLTINVSHPLNLSRIDKTFRKHVLVSLSGLEDPVFPLSTTGYVKRVVRRYEYPFYARKIVSGVSSGNCSGEVTFNSTSPDSEKILVVHDASGVSGFAGIVSESLNQPAVSCYIIGAANAVDLINQTIQESGYDIIHLDNLTDSVWSIPLINGIKNSKYYASKGPNFLQRLEGNLSVSPDNKGMESFVLLEPGLPVKDNQTRTDYLYFDNSTRTGCYKARWVLEDWIRMSAEEISRYNLTQLSYYAC